MKLLLSLAILGITWAMCQGACFRSLPKAVIKNGDLLPPDGCIDPTDGSKHPLGSVWDTAECLHCDCDNTGGLECCHRYGGVVHVEGCRAIVNPKTCEYEFFDIEDPKKPCRTVS